MADALAESKLLGYFSDKLADALRRGSFTQNSRDAANALAMAWGAIGLPIALVDQGGERSLTRLREVLPPSESDQLDESPMLSRMNRMTSAELKEVASDLQTVHVCIEQQLWASR